MDIEISDPELKAITNRIKRAQGQLSGVLRMIEEGRDCQEVVTQLAAASRALDKAGFAIVASGLRSCLADGKASDSPDVQSLERLFMSLA